MESVRLDLKGTILKILSAIIYSADQRTTHGKRKVLIKFYLSNSNESNISSDTIAHIEMLNCSIFFLLLNKNIC